MVLDSEICDALIDALCKRENFSELLRLLYGAGEQGLALNLATCRTLIRGFTRWEIWTMQQRLWKV